ncbi:MAG: hypothetical protein ACK5LM_00980, partial [Lactovum sp.]
MKFASSLRQSRPQLATSLLRYCIYTLPLYDMLLKTRQMKYSFFFLFLFSVFLFSQTPKEKFTLSQNYIYLANLDFYKKNYKLATKRFKEAFKIHKSNDSYNILNAAASGFKSGDNKFARKMVVESITKYAAPKEFVLEYEKYKDFKSDSIFKEIENNYDFYINEYFRNLKNPNAYFEVQKLVEEDKNIRQFSDDIQNRIALDKKAKWKLDSIFNKKMIEVDSSTTNKLIEITKKYGYEDRAWLFFWHQRGQEYKDGNTEFWKFFIPVIEKEIQNGNLHESFFGLFDDENELRYGKQIFGYYLYLF